MCNNSKNPHWCLQEQTPCLRIGFFPLRNASRAASPSLCASRFSSGLAVNMCMASDPGFQALYLNTQDFISLSAGNSALGVASLNFLELQIHTNSFESVHRRQWSGVTPRPDLVSHLDPDLSSPHAFLNQFLEATVMPHCNISGGRCGLTWRRALGAPFLSTVGWLIYPVKEMHANSALMSKNWITSPMPQDSFFVSSFPLGVLIALQVQL